MVKNEKTLTRREAARLAYMLKIERELHAQGVTRIGGIDEAGRGPLAGPVCAAVVVFPPGVRIARVNDSKKLSPEVREALFDQICEKAEGVGVGLADAEEIDSINILNATKLAVRRALESLSFTPDQLLLDALTLKDCPIPQQAFVKGDARCFSIAAASIIAKVTRDRLMVRYAQEYPYYGLQQHKGYGTKMHWEAIETHGVSSIHRRTFFDPGFFNVELKRSQTHAQLCALLASAGCQEDVQHALELIRSQAGFLPRCEISDLEALAQKRLEAIQGIAKA